MTQQNLEKFVVLASLIMGVLGIALPVLGWVVIGFFACLILIVHRFMD